MDFCASIASILGLTEIQAAVDHRKLFDPVDVHKFLMDLPPCAPPEQDSRLTPADHQMVSKFLAIPGDS